MAKLTLEQVKYYLNTVPGWRLAENQVSLNRTFLFSNFLSSVNFVNQMAKLVEPDSEHLEIGIANEKVRILLTTPDQNGLTGKDFALAQLISKLI